MSIKLAYLGIVIIWSTTPLAVQWSSEPLPLFSVMVRMAIGIIGCSLFMSLRRTSITFNRHTLPLFTVAGISVFLAMSIVYMAATMIPSGWISVLFGLSPIITGICARYALQEDNLSRTKITGMCLGIIGLALVFASGAKLDEQAVWGITLCLLAVSVTACSTVFLKKLNQNSQLSGIQTNVGGLTVALPLFIVSWLVFEYQTNTEATANFAAISMRAYLSMAYLGIIATTLGFTLYYYLLKNIDATRVSMIALITPMTALFLGSWLNNEPIVWTVWLGAVLICSGLLLFELNLRDSWRGLRRYFRGV